MLIWRPFHIRCRLRLEVVQAALLQMSEKLLAAVQLVSQATLLGGCSILPRQFCKLEQRSLGPQLCPLLTPQRLSEPPGSTMINPLQSESDILRLWLNQGFPTGRKRLEVPVSLSEPCCKPLGQGWCCQLSEALCSLGRSREPMPRH